MSAKKNPTQTNPTPAAPAAKTAAKMSQELGNLVPPEDYLHLNELFITHGRAVCIPRKPKCGECVLRDICPFFSLSNPVTK